jgi:hypothetical protein
MLRSAHTHHLVIEEDIEVPFRHKYKDVYMGWGGGILEDMCYERQ